MLSIQQSNGKSTKCTPNLIPCRLNHNGAVNASERFWKPETESNGENTAYFRGRKLRGKNVKLPDRYRGAVLDITDKVAPQTGNENSNGSIDDQDEDNKPAEVKVVEEVGCFDEIMIWGHESAPSATEDQYLKGIQEWIALAEAMHCSDESTAPTTRAL
ncbi:ribonuclease H1 small subunit [Lepidopterella palustris CBS 459.81]|uniref:Ribonuclease H1 small subunit n=1 Tax=Lepidopterella palustris CBS 459.81 TaxID=1314670 RepID=A0A8E2JIK1_9PEZI|nr:ribonuclease H1 small subunit [Lepidopterella palustris CBS 459.81]